MSLPLHRGEGLREPEVMSEINTTPLIDVMLVLLIMFIVTLPIQLHAVDVRTPRSSASPAPPRPSVILRVGRDGRVQWDGQPVAGRADLQRRLRQLAQMTDAPEVQVLPDPQTDYAHVATVLADAQRLGVRRLGVVDGEAASMRSAH
jgi:biopolymer transport protein ExbD